MASLGTFMPALRSATLVALLALAILGPVVRAQVPPPAFTPAARAVGGGTYLSSPATGSTVAHASGALSTTTSGVVTAEYAADNVSVFSVAPGAFTSVANIATGANSGPAAVQLADVDGDNLGDVIVFTNGWTIFGTSSGNVVMVAPAIKIYTQNTGTPMTFTLAQTIPLTSILAQNGDCLAVANIFGGGPDIVFADLTNNRVQIFANTAGVYGAATNFAVSSAPAAVTILDAEGDADLDVVSAGSGIDSLLNTGGVFAAGGTLVFAGSSATGITNLVNASGATGVVATANGATTVVTAIGSATPATVVTSASLGTTLADVAAGDVDNDGAVDLVGSLLFSNQMLVIRNVAGTPTAEALFAGTLGSANYTTIELIDFDGDGSLDVLHSGGQGAQYAFFDTGILAYAATIGTPCYAGGNLTVSTPTLGTTMAGTVIGAAPNATVTIYFSANTGPSAGTALGGGCISYCNLAGLVQVATGTTDGFGDFSATLTNGGGPITIPAAPAGNAFIGVQAVFQAVVLDPAAPPTPGYAVSDAVLTRVGIP
jgi:hypothetical protein